MATIQIRNVPEELHRLLKARAGRAGMPLSRYLLFEVRALAERPTIEELRARLERRTRVRTSIASADAVRAERRRRRET